MTKIKPPSDEEFEEMLARYERERAIPWRVASIEKWIGKIKANRDDVRNSPDRRRTNDGAWFIAKSTDLNEMLRHCTTTQQYWMDGKFELALSSLRDLETRVNETNSRLTAPLIATGRKVRDAAKRGGRKNMNEQKMAREYAKRLKTTRLSPTALKIEIGGHYGIKSRSGRIDAVKRAVERYCPQTREEDA